MSDARIARDDPRLPVRFAHVTPPPRDLFASGDPSLLWRGRRIGIVGSRRPRTDAIDAARIIAADAARAGFVVVSGLALGIDAVAHEAALGAGGATIAVLAGGLDNVRPRQNLRLAQRIAGASTRGGVAAGARDAPGLVVSEYGARDEPARPFQFALRNRTIAALSDYLVVVQARHDSGSMGTAEHALRLGIQVGVLPSSPDDPCHGGTTALITDGADAVVDGPSLFRRLELHGVMRPGFADAALRGARADPDDPGGWLGGDATVQLELIDDSPLLANLRAPRTAEDLADLAGLDLSTARLDLLELEDRGLVRRLDDGTWARSTRSADPPRPSCKMGHCEGV